MSCHHYESCLSRTLSFIIALFYFDTPQCKNEVTGACIGAMNYVYEWGTETQKVKKVRTPLINYYMGIAFFYPLQCLAQDQSFINWATSNNEIILNRLIY